MVKRILVIVLVIMLCVPCLAVVASADTVEEFNFPLTSDSVYGGEVFMFSPDIITPGIYNLKVSGGSDSFTFYAYNIEVIYSPGNVLGQQLDSVFQSAIEFDAFYGGVSMGSINSSLVMACLGSSGMGLFVFDGMTGTEGYSVTFTRIPDVGISPFAVLLNSISSGLLGVLSWIGIVVGAFLMPGGFFVELWPFFAIGLLIAIVFGGVGLIRKFSP